MREVDAEPITLTPLSLDLGAPIPLDEPAVGVDVPATQFHPAPLDAAASPAPLGPPPREEDPLAIRTTPPAVIVPAIGDVTSGPESLSMAAPAMPAP
jgi:hypothetical protein